MNEVDSPAAAIERFAELIGSGQLDEALALYEPDAAFAVEPGRVVSGHEAIREALAGFMALNPTLTGTIEKELTAGDTALVVNDWTLRGTDPKGGEVTMAAKSADVLRRRDDGSWAILIDDPWGAT
jgi:ketosteroid isomerase-like protein